MNSDKVLYTAKTHTIGGRDGGSSRTSDGRLDINLSAPGTSGNGTNPEQLFAAGWSACFLSAIKVSAAKMKIALPADPAIDAEVDLRASEDGYFLKARLNVSLPGLEREVALRLTEAADRVCPYSRATRGNVAVAINGRRRRGSSLTTMSDPSGCVSWRLCTRIDNLDSILEPGSDKEKSILLCGRVHADQGNRIEGRTAALAHH